MPAVDPAAILINGAARATASARDRGLQFGDGVFETIAVRRRVPLLPEAHVDRLRAGARRLAIEPGVARDRLIEEIHW